MAAAFTFEEFEARLAAHELAGTRCLDCGGLHLPPRPLCPDCGGSALEWVRFKGIGTIEAFSNIHFPPAALVAAGYERKNPNCTAIVRLEEGPAISAQIVGPDLVTTPDVRVGVRVKAEFVARGEGDGRRTFLVFVPAA